MKFYNKNDEYIYELFENKYQLDMFKHYVKQKYSTRKMYDINNFIKIYQNFEELSNLYSKYVEDTDSNLLKIKINTPSDIDVIQISELLRNLNIINCEIAKVLGFPRKQLIFKLKSIKKGCVELTIIHGVVGAAIEVVATPVIKGLIGQKNLDLIENNTELLKEVFINFITSKSTKLNSYATKNAINAKKRFYKTLSNVKDIQSINIKNNRKSKSITKDKFLDYYA